ncbi:hypothetical protein ACIO3O_37615 [Streptomyces sp. NPDC087440]|uniref:hypothetical protein n=1 Tax=Streptomyces sp. NPDC087440 TaxID=3365790 RepID=UPI003805886B
MFNLFIDDVRMVLAVDDAYEASALVNTLVDAGHTVCSDLWSAYDETAMLTPALYAACGGDLVSLAQRF